ncbi:GntR family transcriptional regulator [Mangrovicoccus sp. HB161399]|uniref:GntR family transcriptional regulator n=1 Tax=Mangrovicoccus sp. HB161399 TaxID=2720392 RepID=UPI0015566543|nr:GntR family transcriptional regulator [Mangrovicoccus sp. HB161399]
MDQARQDGRIGGRTRYAILAEALMEDIRSGRYPVGSLLPTELDLCSEFDVSRHTVREAIRRLVDLGLVTRQAGVGTTVRADRLSSRYVQTGESFLSLFQYVREVNLRVLGTQDITAGEEMLDLLECKAGQVWLQVDGERYLVGDEQPIALTAIWIARPYRAIASELRAPSEPVYSLIERRFGLTTTEIRQEISSVLIEGEASRRLGVAEGAPGLKVVRKYIDEGGAIYEVAVSLHPGERFSYSSAMKVERGLPEAK